MNTNKQNQRAGDNSCLVQAENIIQIYNGSYSDSVKTVSCPLPKADDVIKNYLNKASLAYASVKNLLNPTIPMFFDDIFVCNNLKIFSKTIENVSVEKIELISNHLIIKGSAGSGKSMLLKHLFLNTASNYSINKKIPILIQSVNLYRGEKFKNYILDKLREFSEDFSYEILKKQLIDRRVILFIDALDEVKANYLSTFISELQALVKEYPTLPVILTTRPIDSFIELPLFVSCDICCFTLEQSIEFIRKQKYDDVIKLEFENALSKGYYKKMKNFASNPLLLTIMLLTYSDDKDFFSSKRVDFYSKVYNTLAKQHNKSLTSEKKLYTNISYIEFAELFAEFCAITFKDGICEFDEFILKDYIKKVVSKKKNEDVTLENLLFDLTVNMCLMFQTGDKYFFIHRSFQEYFTAVYFSSLSEKKLVKLGELLNSRDKYNWKNVLDMLYELIPQKIEKCIFLPYLSSFFTNQNHFDKKIYWNWLKSVYFCFMFVSNKYEYMLNSSGNIIYKKIFSIIFSKSKYKKNISKSNSLFNPYLKARLQGIPRNMISIGLKNHSHGTRLDDESLEQDLQLFLKNDASAVLENNCFKDLDSIYEFCRFVNSSGFCINIPYQDLINNPSDFTLLRNSMENDEFPLMIEYKSIYKYYEEIKSSVNNSLDWNELFEDS